MVWVAGDALPRSGACLGMLRGSTWALQGARESLTRAPALPRHADQGTSGLKDAAEASAKNQTAPPPAVKKSNRYRTRSKPKAAGR